MKKLLTHFQKLRPILARLEPSIERLLYTLSFVSVALVVLNEFIPRALTIPFLDLSWTELLWWVQLTTWSAYVADFVLFGLASGKPIEYVFGAPADAKGESSDTKGEKRPGHLLELAICFFWFPFSGGALLHQMHDALSLQTLLLAGVVAHLFRLARGAIRQFNHNPWIVLISAAGVLMTAFSALLMEVEPRTFTSFPDSLWYVYMTTFTIGTNLSPVTLWGRLVTVVVVAVGVGLSWVFIGFMAETARHILFRNRDSNAQILAELRLSNKLVAECNERLKQVLECGKDGCSIHEELSQHRKMLEQLLTAMGQPIPPSAAGSCSTKTCPDQPDR